MIKPLTILATTAALMIGLAGCTAPTPDTENPDTPPTTAAPTDTMVEEDTEVDSPETVTLPEAPPAGTPAAIAWEALMGPDGEFAASASYLAVIEKFGEVEPYVSIQAAEERHSDALVRQLTRLGVETPENPYIGKIAAPDNLEPELTELVTTKIAQAFKEPRDFFSHSCGNPMLGPVNHDHRVFHRS